MKTPDGRHVVHIECLDVRIILPLPGADGPILGVRGQAGSAGNKRDAKNRRTRPEPREKKKP